MSDAGAIGVILDDLINILKTMVVETYEEETVDFAIKILEYVEYLASKEGIDLDMENHLDKKTFYDLENGNVE
jgi:hypothetical protein